MNILTAMRKQNLGDRIDPPVPSVPRPSPPPRSAAVAEWIDYDERQREENAWLRSENAELKTDLKVAQERLRDVEAELTHVRNERDWLTRHDAKMLSTCEDVMALITARLKDARAHAFAQPGTGQQEHEQPTERDDQIIENLATALAPERTDA